MIPTGGLHSQAEAQALADAAIDALTAPPDAQVTTNAPLTPGDFPGAQVDTRADTFRTWLVSSTRDAAVAWFKSHLPPGLVAGEYEKMSDSSPAATWTRFLSLDPVDTHHQPAATTDLTFTPKGDHVVVVAHAEVVWTPAKTAVETIPADVTTGTLAYTSALSSSAAQHVLHHTLTAAEVVQVATVLNAQQTQAPGVRSCPSDDGERAVLTFKYGGNHVVFTLTLTGCTDVAVTSDDVTQPSLAYGGALADPIRAMVDVPVIPSTAP